MRMACVPVRDFLCKLCRRISSDKKENCIKDKSGNFIKNLTDLTYNRNIFESDLQYLKTIYRYEPIPNMFEPAAKKIRPASSALIFYRFLC